MNQPDLWLVRHGATEWTATRQHTGRTDIALTAEGRREAAALYQPLDRQAFAASFTSPLVRARETAKIPFRSWTAEDRSPRRYRRNFRS